jgi:hypothetical protein
MFKCDDNIAVKCEGGDETTGTHPILIVCGMVDTMKKILPRST